MKSELPDSSTQDHEQKMNEGINVIEPLESGSLAEEKFEKIKELKQRVEELSYDTTVLASKVKDLINYRQISKQIDPLGREELAHGIWSDRSRRRDLNKKETLIQQEVEKKQQEIKLSQDKENEYREKIEKRKETVLGQLLEKIHLPDFYLSKVKEKKFREEILRSTLTEELGNLTGEAQEFSRQINEIPNPKDLLKAYYEKFDSKPLSIAEKKELLKPEVLSELSTSEYIQLWKKLNPYFLSHVTRQGFRDHYGMDNHRKGFGEFHNGFKAIMMDQGLLRPPLAAEGLKDRSKETIKNWLENITDQQGNKVFESNKKTAMGIVYQRIIERTADAPKYPDKTAVHFMNERIGDDLYGSESGNEVFFIFPTDVIASQYKFGNVRDWGFTIENPNSQERNDIFVWPEDINNPGITVDAGFAFLPKSTLVDPKTGSQYVSEVVTDNNGVERRVMSDSQADKSNFITAEAYWKQYFLENPDQEPKHVIYYEGSPTSAVYNFLIENNIGRADTSEIDGNLLGFDGNLMNMEKDPYVSRGVKELSNTAKAIIKEHYESVLNIEEYLLEKNPILSEVINITEEDLKAFTSPEGFTKGYDIVLESFKGSNNRGTMFVSSSPGREEMKKYLDLADNMDEKTRDKYERFLKDRDNQRIIDVNISDGFFGGYYGSGEIQLRFSDGKLVAIDPVDKSNFFESSLRVNSMNVYSDEEVEEIIIYIQNVLARAFGARERII